MALSSSRTPILDYASANAIPTYVPPTVIPDPKDTWLTETTAQGVTTEDNIDIQWDADMSIDGDTLKAYDHV